MPNSTQQYQAGVTHQSRNYDRFTFMEANRGQSRGHIEALKRAFEEIGNLTEVQPILVNERLEIIDGQHRFVAAKELGQPIYFVVRQGLRISDARAMNILHRNWNNDDYARSYATTDPNYQTYLDLREYYGFNHSITLMYIYGDNVKGIHSTFTRGEMVVNDLPATRERLDRLADALAAFPQGRNDTHFANAFLKISGSPAYDHIRMLKKLVSVGESVIRKYGSVSEYQRALEETYNYNMKTNRIRLY